MEILLNHLHLPCANVGVSMAFYCNHLGFRMGRLTDDGTQFIHDPAGFDLALAQVEDPLAFPPRFHLGFRMDSEAQVIRLHDRMLRDGVEVIQPLTEEPGMTWFRCMDPEGRTLEIYHEAGDDGA